MNSASGVLQVTSVCTHVGLTRFPGLEGRSKVTPLSLTSAYGGSEVGHWV